MDGHSMSLPPMKPLVAFEAAARLKSFTRASAELHLTHGAVSRQISLLEAHFGCPLFVRLARGVELTSGGARLFDIVHAMLPRLAELSNNIATRPNAGEVKISVTPSLGARWLLARLPPFQRSHPGIVVRLDASLALVDLDREPVDFSIRYGLGKWTGVVSELLLEEDLTPVCAPGLIPMRGASIDALANVTLLHDTAHGAWLTWLAAAGRSKLLDTAASQVFNDYNLLVEAALNGTGVGMGRWQLIADHIAEGRLFPPLKFHTGRRRARCLIV